MMLDELAAFHPDPIRFVLKSEVFVLKSEVERKVRRGKPLPPELAKAPWGKAEPNGLRVA